MNLRLLLSLLITASGILQGEEWKRHTIESANPKVGLRGADGIRALDINGDSLLDLVTGWEEGNAIRVYLHPGKEACKAPWPAVTVGKVRDTEDAVFADLDGDGSVDVISSSEGNTKQHWIHWGPKNPEALLLPDSWKSELVPQTDGTERWMFCLPLDVDADGALDLVVGSKGSNASVSWLQNPGHDSARNLEQWKLHRVAEAAWIMSLRLLEDEQSRFLVYSDRKGANSGIFLVPILKEAPFFGPPQCIGGAGNEVMFLDLAKVDDNETIVIIAAIRPNVIEVFYQPESIAEHSGSWQSDKLMPVTGNFGTVKAVAFSQIEGDEIPEFVITCENADGKKCGVLFGTVFSEYFPLTSSEGIKFDRIEMIDIDEDGDLDLVTCEERTGLGVIWYENPR